MRKILGRGMSPNFAEIGVNRNFIVGRVGGDKYDYG